MTEATIRELYHLPGLQDPFSAISHLCGAAIFLVLGILLLRRGWGSALRVAFLAVYAFSGVLLFSMSGVYHMLPAGGAGRAVLIRLDHAAIFVLIAATFTPLHGLLFRGCLRWGPIAFVWVTAAVAITLKTIFFEGFPGSVGLGLYLGLGWLGALSAVLVARLGGFAMVAPLLWGGLAYSVGAVAEFVGWPVVVDRVIGPHEVFHLAVLAGALFHFAFVWRIAEGRRFAAGARSK